MTEGSGKLVSGETRPALADVSNISRKRGISSILGDWLRKSEDGSGKFVAHEGSREKFSKRLCLVVDDLVKENATPIDTKNEEGSSSEFKHSSGDSDDKESEESRDAVMEVSSGDGEPLKEIYFEPGDKDGARELKVAPNAIQSDVSTGKGQNLRSFEMSRCSNVNKEEEEHVNQDVGDDLLKSCSCSFCLKAAYIWSDLHYQDIKGRLSALKKSQKMAGSLIQRNVKERPTDFHDSVSSAKLQSSLMGQWRSLFLSMGDILAHESNHLQSSFLTMKELREDCKVDLERAMKTTQPNT
ncbi:unnamed protein product [Microthlaspi erraticum]|uniref:Uncharacterized protein n=1 Tax=Microthlaspi erraticum TaxID=1685480 RepID=A0A6D2IGH8_9BRAS|nr:unnamed protein product [Microthlaspi erraticum]